MCVMCIEEQCVCGCDEWVGEVRGDTYSYEGVVHVLGGTVRERAEVTD